MFCRMLFVLLYFFLLAIVLPVLFRYTDSDYPFGIFKLFLKLVFLIYIDVLHRKDDIVEYHVLCCFSYYYVYFVDIMSCHIHDDTFF